MCKHDDIKCSRNCGGCCNGKSSQEQLQECIDVMKGQYISWKAYNATHKSGLVSDRLYSLDISISELEETLLTFGVPREEKWWIKHLDE